MPSPITSPPNPNDIRRQCFVDAPKGTGDTDAIAPNLAMVAATTYGSVIAVAGSAKLRFRAKATVAATLRGRFVLANGADAATQNPSDAALVANTENFMEVVLFGEGAFHVQVICGGAPGTLLYVDVSQI